ncbi:AzlD domain-containing protein [Aeromicrobium sp. 636]|uniref:AzlD domain-containing protein n=1 Tax=Aeromicrobium senzhongii TaxID=2663859 RepID=A0A8I0JZ05_9ACTN|nr:MULTISPECIES: AzlD domain-containing protein [Aeromicrobium]MBC9224781.1 AzlD domain-containing protein [Aeromicrobium senzhongii]MCQ3996894.1 AzlD domain-containing protein [Aeromicrobium sp. 636]
MSELWWGVLMVAVGCYGLKLLGLSVPERVLEHPLTVRAAAFIPVGLLAALVVVQGFSDGSRVVVDARLAGLAVAAFLLWRKVPFLVMLIAAAATAALVRAVAG